jgi:carboxyl-terminal processing protease
LILSIAKYYSPSGKAIQDAAVTPNVMVADAADDAGLPDDDLPAVPEEKKEKKPKNPTDEQLNKALEVLKNRESKG